MGQAVVPIAIAVASAAAAAGASALLTKPAKVASSPPPPNRNDAASAAANDKEFRHRQGAVANMLTGPNGVEAPSPGVKALLGQ